MSFFKLSTGEAAKSNGSYEQKGGGNFEPIPDGTKVKATVTEGTWDESPYDGRIIKLKWQIIDGEFKNRVLFHKLKVTDSDANKRDKAVMMLAAIDANTGGKIMKLDHEPSGVELSHNFAHKPMTIQVRVWEMYKDENGNRIEKDQYDPSQGHEKASGNWVSAVEGKNSNAKPAAQPQQQAQQKPKEPDVSEDMDGSIPF